jgi:hypothetical protein
MGALIEAAGNLQLQVWFLGIPKPLRRKNFKIADQVSKKCPINTSVGRSSMPQHP